LGQHEDAAENVLQWMVRQAEDFSTIKLCFVAGARATGTSKYRTSAIMKQAKRLKIGGGT
jgi:hypothetical protein